MVDNVNKVRKLTNAKLEEQVIPRPISPVDTPAFSSYTVDDNFNIPISVAFAILIFYIIGGAILFSPNIHRYILAQPTLLSLDWGVNRGPLELAEVGFSWDIAESLN